MFFVPTSWMRMLEQGDRGWRERERLTWSFESCFYFFIWFGDFSYAFPYLQLPEQIINSTQLYMR